MEDSAGSRGGGGCGGLDAQIEQLMECRPLPETEVRPAAKYRSISLRMIRLHRGFTEGSRRFRMVGPGAGVSLGLDRFGAKMVAFR